MTDMTNANIFEVAVREKLRFPFKGLVTVEDLWDLSVNDLDNIFKILSKQVKEEQEESLLSTKTNEENEVRTKIEIIKYIVNEKLEQQERIKNERALKEQKQRIMEVLKGKEDEELKSKSAEELKEMLKNI